MKRCLRTSHVNEQLLKLRHAIGRSRRNRARRPDARWGVDFIDEAKLRFGLSCGVIFDVGAHIGITALHFSNAFPEAKVHAFEPGSRNFDHMSANLSGKPDIQRHKFAIGAEPGEAILLIEPDHPSMARIGEGQGPTEVVKVETLDHFCRAHGIDAVAILKIDVEGFEMNVLTGAEQLLSESRVALVKLECGADPDIAYNANLRTVSEHMFARGYRLFGIYDE